MIRKRDKASFEDFEKHGFKWGTRDRFIYKTKSNGIESCIYIDLLPCHNNHNELKIETPSNTIPDKITDKLYDLTKANLIEKVDRKKYERNKT